MAFKQKYEEKETGEAIMLRDVCPTGSVTRHLDRFL